MYDQAADEPRPSARRRPSQATDWGVSEELFDRMPGPRFDRRPAGHRHPPEESVGVGRAHEIVGAARRDEIAATGAHDEVVRPARDEVVPARRTVKITGRPGAFAEPPRPARRRPPPTVHERVGARPDRIAAWAFALGMLLILIALATSQI